MEKIVLMVGTVAASQEEGARQHILRQHCTPKLVSTTLEELFPVDARLTAKHRDDHTPTDRETQRAETMAQKHLETFGDVGAIILDPMSFTLWDKVWGPYQYSETYNAWRNIPRWIALADGRTPML